MSSTSDDIIHTSSPMAGYLALKDEIGEAIQAVLNQPAYVLGPAVERFEKNFADFVGVTHGIGVNSGTDALHLSLRALEVGKGDEVITVSHTSVATVAGIEMSGAAPVLVDIELPWYTIDPAAVEAAITPRTRAIIAVHLYGQPANLSALRAIADRHQLAVIEDCAQSHGASLNGRRTGSWGEASCFSFYPSKNLGTLGDGGMVLTSSPEVAAKLAQLRQYGWSTPQTSEVPGWNSRLGPLEAAILGVKLKHFEQMVQARGKIAEGYLEAFHDLPLDLPCVRAGAEHAWHLFVIRCDDGGTRQALRDHLAAHRIMAGIHYPFPVHAQPAYRNRIRTMDMTHTEAVSPRILSIPLYPEMNDGQQSRVIEAVRIFFKGSR